MEWIDHTFLSPPENLAAEELLLEWAEQGKCGEILRFWSFSHPFVVLGQSNKITTEVNRQLCEAEGISIWRRCSGGGTVLQGKGCWNYALVLRTDRPGLETVTSTNQTIMQATARVISSVIKEPLAVEGFTDLVWRGKKVSGNAQRRKKNHVLFHGTLLLDFDLPLLERYLSMPSYQPEYRSGRSHLEFVHNLPLQPAPIKEAFMREWGAHREVKPNWNPELAALVREKYSRPEWNFKF